MDRLAIRNLCLRRRHARALLAQVDRALAELEEQVSAHPLAADAPLDPHHPAHRLRALLPLRKKLLASLLEMELAWLRRN